MAGRKTLVLDKGKVGREASWLSAGMLAPDTELGFEDEALHRLGRESLGRWRQFAATLEKASGLLVDYRTNGTIHVAEDRDAVEALRRQFTFQQEQGLEVQWLTNAEARDLEPFIAPRIAGAVYSASDHQVDNRLLVEALHAALVKAGGTLYEQTSVEAIGLSEESNSVSHTESGHIIVHTDTGESIAADTVVVAAGAWSRSIDGLEPADRPAVRPVKGQMIQLKMASPFELQHVVWGRDAYLAPKSNGRLLVGATVEERGFDSTVTAGGLYKILEAGWRIVPGIYDLEVTETWAGLRPGSRDNDPILGTSPYPGVLFATGHYRNGILLTPVTAEEMTRLIMTGETSDWLMPFSSSRFSRHEVPGSGTHL